MEPTEEERANVQEGYRRTVERIDTLLEVFHILAGHARVRADQGHMNREVWVTVSRGLGVMAIRRRESAPRVHD